MLTGNNEYMEEIEWCSIPVLARKMGISDNTIRRYLRNFPGFFLSRTVNGIKKYPVTIIEVLRRIYDLYLHEGKTRDEIRATIETEFPRDIDLDEPIEDMPIPVVARPVALAPEFVEKIDRLTTAFERVAESLERQADQEKRIEALEIQLKNLLPSSPAFAVSKDAPVKEGIEISQEPTHGTEQPDYQENPEAYRQFATALIRRLKDDDDKNYREISAYLADKEILTLRGKVTWSQQMVSKLYREG